MDGKPKNLDEAIASALCVGPLSQIRERAHAVFRSYLSMKFGAKMLEHPECERVLNELFHDITKRNGAPP